MHILNLAVAAAVIAAPLVSLAVPAMAATAHNSQAGAYGQSSNATASTPSSPRVKHAAKHRRM